MRVTEEQDPARLMEDALGQHRLPWRYLKAYDPDAHGGLGFIALTDDIGKACRFDSLDALFAEWGRQSKTRPLRDAARKPPRGASALAAADRPSVRATMSMASRTGR